MSTKLSKKQNLKLVYLHGWGGNAKSLQPLSHEINQILDQQNIENNSLIIELPGFGTTALPRAFTFQDYVSYVGEKIAQFASEEDEIVVISHSFGGKILAQMAVEGTLGRAKLVFINVSVLKPKRSLKRQILFAAAKIYSPFKALLNAIGLRKVQKLLQKAFYKFIVKARDYQKIDAAGNETLKATFRNVVHVYHDPAKLGQISQPTLILWAENDKDTPLWMGEKLHTLIHGSQFKSFADTTHGLPLHHPELLAPEIVNFITNP